LKPITLPAAARIEWRNGGADPHLTVAIEAHATTTGLHLLVDSTDIKMLGEGEWKIKKHGAVKGNPIFPSCGNRKFPTRSCFSLLRTDETGLQFLFQSVRIAADIQCDGMMQ
jgi:hypothetical protein